MRIIIFSLLLLGFLIMNGPSYAQVDNCRKSRASVKFNVNLNDAEEKDPLPDIAKSMEAYDTKISLKIEADSKQRVGCINIRAIFININVTPIIHNYSRYIKGTCQDDVLRAHEKEHLKFIGQYFSQLQNKYALSVQNEFAPYASFHAKEASTTNKKMREISKSLINDINKEFRALLLKNIDKPEVVKAMMVQCPSW